METHFGFRRSPDWEDPSVLQVNREAPHVLWGAFHNAEAARTSRRMTGPLALDLDGTWAFRLVPSPAVAEPFWEEEFNDRDWSGIRVPGSWEMQGFGEPAYTNTFYPWRNDADEHHMIRPHILEPDRDVRPDPPRIPSDNPTGCYRRTFRMPEAWRDMDVFLAFDGVETAFRCWVNGTPAGYAQDSKLPSEFQITSLVRAGDNRLAVQVFRYAASSYLEDQDYWHLCGIHRSVRVFARPKRRIVDYRILAEPEGFIRSEADGLHAGGRLWMDVTVNRFPGYADYRIRAEVYGPDDRWLCSAEADIAASAQYRQDRVPTANTARLALRLEEVTLWTPETPVLYRVVLTLLSPDGSGIDWEGCRAGFHRIRIEAGILTLNERRLLVQGVNRHEHDSRTGRTLSREDMEAEIRCMKRMGINSVRTSHYPDDPAWYDLCDAAGLLLVAECNLETHGVLGELTHDPSWSGAFLDRLVRMAVLYKNHPCIYAWSLGNESGVGPNHAAMAGWIREYDPSRICQYEAGDPGRSVSDIRGCMYATQDHILRMLADASDDRPIILVEYLYQIRNSGGGLHRFLDLADRFPRFQGGLYLGFQGQVSGAGPAGRHLVPGLRRRFRRGDPGSPGSALHDPQWPGPVQPGMEARGIRSAACVLPPPFPGARVRQPVGPGRTSRPVSGDEPQPGPGFLPLRCIVRDSRKRRRRRGRRIPDPGHRGRGEPARVVRCAI